MNLKRFLIIGLSSLFALTLGAQAALATSGAHFNSASSSVSSSGQLLISFDEAGLGNQNVTYVLSNFSQSATYACYNNGGNHPAASNKVGPTPPSTETVGTFEAKNGRVTVKNAPVAGTPLASTLTCPPGQTERLVQVTYSFDTLVDTTNNVSTPITAPGCVSFDTKNFPC